MKKIEENGSKWKKMKVDRRKWKECVNRNHIRSVENKIYRDNNRIDLKRKCKKRREWDIKSVPVILFFVYALYCIVVYCGVV